MFVKFKNRLLLSVDHIVSVSKVSEDDYIVRLSSPTEEIYRIGKQEYDGLLYLLGSMWSKRALCDIDDPAVHRNISRNATPDEPTA